jgi:hypothetical protein
MPKLRPIVDMKGGCANIEIISAGGMFIANLNIVLKRLIREGGVSFCLPYRRERNLLSQGKQRIGKSF